MASATLSVRSNLFPRIAARFPVAAAGATNQAIARTIEVADPLTPVDTGALRGNKVIRAATGGDPSGEIHWAQHYAGYQEFGTVRGIVGKRYARQGAQAGAALWLNELSRLESELL